MKLRRALIALALVAFMSQSAFAALIVPGDSIPPGEKHVYEIFNELYGTSYTSNMDPTFLANQVVDFQTLTLDPSICSITFQAVYRQSYLEDNIYLYDDVNAVGDPTSLTHIVGPIDNTGPNSGQGNLTGFQPAVTIDVSGMNEIGFLDHAVYPPDSSVYFDWYSQYDSPDRNAGQYSTGSNEDHVLLWQVPGQSNTYLLTWEDLPFTYFSDGVDIGDQDYNDIVVQLTLNPCVVPEPSSMALLGLGLAGLAVRKFRRKSVKA